LLNTWLPLVDVVVDCCDNFATRHAVNAACVRHGKPLVSGAALQMDGQLAVYDPRSPVSPCYACVFPPDALLEETRCATMGVFAPLVGLVGTLQATEAIKLLAGMPSSMTGQLMMIDARTLDITRMTLARNPDCPVCGKPPHH
jgi:molybdopterin/thiamine biosynthesis adenylyltransferase